MRKPLFLKRNIRQFNKKLSNEIKLENEDDPPENIGCVSLTNTSAIQKASPSDQQSLFVSTPSLTSSPPVLLSSKKTQESANNIRNLPEKTGQTNSFKDFFIDDQEQAKFNYQTYKTVFCNTTNKGYILYRYNSLKRSKQVSIIRYNLTKI